ncbi:VOC family protein [Streptomyces sp. YIM 98790]|uniref:VOC family protein n=1 Tax=Streptomyces sp. YIM 98790 TaxID=2689077 RepID=UPI00140CCFA0|nr:VOC family protein [Streptomyces sp. YIM 98790]
MHLNHLGLPVRDVARSKRFYETYFGFGPGTARQYDDGTVIIRNADGFDLALHGVQEVGPPPPFLHFGFRLAAPGEVRALLARMRGDGLRITEDYDEPAYVAFKCADPDGHQVETYWEPHDA